MLRQGLVSTSDTVQDPVVAPAPPSPVPAAGVDVRTGEGIVAAISTDKDRAVLQQYGFNLRGAQCELLNGREQCFFDDGYTPRELCPEHVDSVFLTLAKGQWSCQPESEQADTYCTAMCQTGTDRVSWHAHGVAYCGKSPGSCPPPPSIIPVTAYSVSSWSAPPRVPTQCTAPADGVPRFTLGMLARKDTETLLNTLRSFEAAGFLQLVPELLLFVNDRSPATDAAVSRYTQPPFNVKVMGDSGNYGVTRPLNWLTGNASHEAVLFVQQEFQLVESVECAMQQIAAAVRMLQRGIAHVVRFRSRRNSGRPNWARITYAGKEDSVLQREPNHLCNNFYWIKSPELRWPGKFWGCEDQALVDGTAAESSVWYCSRSSDCNWTNNPSMVSRSWWHTEYEVTFPGTGAYDNLESHLARGQKSAWDDRPWTVAQGLGLFKLADASNFGGGLPS